MNRHITFARGNAIYMRKRVYYYHFEDDEFTAFKLLLGYIMGHLDYRIMSDQQEKLIEYRKALADIMDRIRSEKGISETLPAARASTVRFSLW